MKLTEENKKRIDDYFSKLTHKELLHINEKYFNKPLEAINDTRCSKLLPSRIEIDSEITDILDRYTLGTKPTPKQDELNDIEKGFRICVEWLKKKVIV